MYEDSDDDVICCNPPPLNLKRKNKILKKLNHNKKQLNNLFQI